MNEAGLDDASEDTINLMFPKASNPLKTDMMRGHWTTKKMVELEESRVLK